MENLPRFCTARELAALFGFTEVWIYKLIKRGQGPPLLKNVRPYRIDTHSEAFREWLRGLGVEVDS